MGLATATARDAWIGRTLGGRYRVLRQLGEGGIGCVYVAEHLTLGRNVALKMLHSHLAAMPTLRQRFEREARALSRLSHPNVVGVVDFGSDGDALYLVMDLVEGETLADRMARDAPNVASALEITRQVVRALAYAHGLGIVHRDLKPGNMLVRRLPDGMDHVTVLDFGLAKFLDEQGAVTLTRNGVVLGTPAYMAPEQAMGDTATTTADVYAATLILFELLTGQRPFPGDEPSEQFRAHLLSPIPHLTDVQASLDVSAELDALVQRGLDKTASRRFPDARAMLVALDALPELAGRQSLVSTSGSTRLDSIEGVSTGTHRAPVAEFESVILGTPVEPNSAVSSAVPVSRVPSAEAHTISLAPQRSSPSIRALRTDEELEEAPRTRRAFPWVAAIVVIALGVVGVVVFVLPLHLWDASVETPHASPVAAPAPPPAPAAPASHGRVPKRDPWVDAIPSEIASLHGAIERGERPSRSALQPLYRHASTNRSDARGLLLLGRTYADRGWHKDAMDAFRDAYTRDPSSRGDPHMLASLVSMASFERFDVRARGYVAEWYGQEALPLVTERIAQSSDAHARTLLERLRAALLTTP